MGYIYDQMESSYKDRIERLKEELEEYKEDCEIAEYRLGRAIDKVVQRYGYIMLEDSDYNIYFKKGNIFIQKRWDNTVDKMVFKKFEFKTVTMDTPLEITKSMDLFEMATQEVAIEIEMTNEDKDLIYIYNNIMQKPLFKNE